jgi:hypothetical protein
MEAQLDAPLAGVVTAVVLAATSLPDTPSELETAHIVERIRV